VKRSITLPFFGGGKAIWLQNLQLSSAMNARANAAAVTESLGELAQELKSFKWDKCAAS
jgi:hypothetical protein